MAVIVVGVLGPAVGAAITTWSLVARWSRSARERGPAAVRRGTRPPAPAPAPGGPHPRANAEVLERGARQWPTTGAHLLEDVIGELDDWRRPRGRPAAAGRVGRDLAHRRPRAARRRCARTRHGPRSHRPRRGTRGRAHGRCARAGARIGRPGPARPAPARARRQRHRPLARGRPGQRPGPAPRPRGPARGGRPGARHLGGRPGADLRALHQAAGLNAPRLGRHGTGPFDRTPDRRGARRIDLGGSAAHRGRAVHGVDPRRCDGCADAQTHPR